MFRSHEEVYRTPCNINKPKSEIYNCDLCDEGGWLSETDMQIHRKDGHSQEIWQIYNDANTFVCLACTKRQKNNKSLIRHVKTEHLLSSENALRVEREIFVCDHCSHIFFNKAVLEYHIVKHTVPAKRFREKKKIIFKCPKCDKRLKLSALWGHLEYHRLQSVSICPICLDKCINRLDLKEHLKKHPKNYHCNMCGYNTTKDNYFIDHVKSHRQKNVPITDVDVQKYFIPSVKTFKPSDLVQYAIKGLLLFKNINLCILCREICTSNAQMKQHILRDHYTPKKVENKQRYICYCGEEFCNNVLLKHHLFKNQCTLTLPSNAEGESSSNDVIEIDETDGDNMNEIKIESQMPIIIESIDNGEIIIQVT